MMTPRTEMRVAADGDAGTVILPLVTYGPMTNRMAIMALIMGGAETTTARRA